MRTGRLQRTPYQQVGTVMEIKLHTRIERQRGAFRHDQTVIDDNRTDRFTNGISLYDLTSPHVGILPHCGQDHPLLYTAFQHEQQRIRHLERRILHPGRHGHFRKDMNAVLAPHFKIISPGAAFRFQIGAVHIDPEGRPFAFLQRDHGYADTFVVGVVNLYPARTGTYSRDHGIKPDGIRRETQQSAGIRRERITVVTGRQSGQHDMQHGCQTDQREYSVHNVEMFF